MKNIQWNKVTWYSKLIAVVVFVATFIIAFNLGIYWEQVHMETSLSSVVESQGDSLAPVARAGEHCGGFIKNAPVCATGYHCQLKVSMPDTGGTCVQN